MVRPITPGNLACHLSKCDHLHQQNKVASIPMRKHIRLLQAGFSYMGILMLIAIAGIGMAGAGMVWHIQIQRIKEQQLLFNGTAIRQAIKSYYASNPSAVGEYPANLDALLLDERQPNIKRHLRRLYRDPMANNEAWTLIMQNNRIIGVHSQSKLKPIKVSGFPLIYESFRAAKTYEDWKFVYVPGME